MKILAIGDTHGRDTWKRFTEQEFDKFVFIGDYFDSRDLKITAAVQMYNFKEILKFKEENPDRVVLLLGNHDHVYLKGMPTNISGYQQISSYAIQQILQPAIDARIVQACYRHENVLFSHAGVTKTWLKYQNIENDENLEQSINDRFHYKPLTFAFTPGYPADQYGNNVEQTPIWVRPEALLKDKIDGYTQVVGHTSMDEIKFFYKNNIFIDVLSSVEQILEYDTETKKFAVQTLKS